MAKKKFRDQDKFFNQLSSLYFERFISNVQDWREDLDIIFDYTEQINHKYKEIDFAVVLKTMRSLPDKTKHLKK